MYYHVEVVKPEMRLAPKIFLASSLVIVVLLGVGALSLRAVGRLVSVNAAIAGRSVPAIRRAAAAHDAVLSLGRIEARFLLLGDAAFAALWAERATRAQEELEGLREFVTTRRERELLSNITRAFADYRDVVAREQALVISGESARARALEESTARALRERVEADLESLSEATHAAAQAAQADAARLEARTWAGVLIALVAALALALAGTALIAIQLTRRLRTLSTATSAVAAGSFRKPIRVQGNDEVADLARSFNAMAERLRELDELKQAFLATVSHELRSPLTSMREAAHLLRDRVGGELTDRQSRMVEIIAGSCERLLRLVNQVLDLSRLRAGVLTLDHQPVDLDRVVTRALDEMRPQAEEAGLALSFERRGNDFVVEGDEDRLVQVFVNLVANAVRFTLRRGRVTVRLHDAGREVEVQVEDTGVGIPAVALPHIFDTWQQAHQQRGGTGLGLAIVRGIVQAHTGRVTVESQEGKGTRFSVLLPRRMENT
jgi:two-component system, NtrC family, sensor histidine kinase GlrK